MYYGDRPKCLDGGRFHITSISPHSPNDHYTNLSKLYCHRLAVHRHALANITSIHCQFGYQPVHELGTRVLQGPTEVSQGRTTSHAVASIQRLIPPSIRCQSCANPMSINCKSDANPISIRVIPRQPSINPRQIRRQSKANNPPILATGASIRCQSSANLMPIQ